MLDFKPLQIADAPLIKPYFEYNKSRFCDYSVGGRVMWREFLQVEYCIQNGVLYMKLRLPWNGATAFTMPLGPGSGDSITGLRNIMETCKVNSIPLILSSISADCIAMLEPHFTVTNRHSSRDWFDYLYNADDMVTLHGKHFSGQRNHINKFKSLYPDYRYEVINDENIPKARLFLTDLFNRLGETDDIAVEEQEKTLEVFDNHAEYGFTGGLIEVNGHIVSLAVGETVGDTLFVHIEKGDTSYHGAYQMIVNEFARHNVTDGIKYINREEDVGDEGLRTSKLSYHPVALLEKFTVQITE